MATAITVVCPKCNNRMRASSEHIGRKGRCPACKFLVEIAAPAGEESIASLHPTLGAGQSRDSDVRLSSTDVPAWVPGIFGAIITTVLYLLIFLPLADTYLGQLFTNRGPMQHCTTLVTCWGLALLAMKYVAVRRQMSFAELELELIPLDVGLQITPTNVDQFLSHLTNLKTAVRQSILGRRIRGALEHFKSRTSVPEVQQYLATQAELDASSVDSGYILLRSFIWVIPLLGFIGTVTGISFAVTGLDEAVKQGGGEKLMDGLGMVTQGLATAFDTTFLALVMAIVLLFPTEALRKTEYAMLDRIEAFTNESLLRRMVEQRSAATEDMPDVVRDALASAFREHQRWLAQWQAQVAQLGQSVGADFEAAVSRAQEQMARSEAAQAASRERLAQLLEQAFEAGNRGAASMQQIEQASRRQAEELVAATSGIQAALAANLRATSELSEQQNRLFKLYSETGLGPSVMCLGEQVSKLVERLASPSGGQEGDGRSAVSEITMLMPASSQELPRPPRGFFGRLWGR